MYPAITRVAHQSIYYFFPLLLSLFGLHSLVGQNSDKLKGRSGMSEERERLFHRLPSARDCFHFYQSTKRDVFLPVLRPAFRVKDYSAPQVADQLTVLFGNFTGSSGGQN